MYVIFQVQCITLHYLIQLREPIYVSYNLAVLILVILALFKLLLLVFLGRYCYDNIYFANMIHFPLRKLFSLVQGGRPN